MTQESAYSAATACILVPHTPTNSTEPSSPSPTVQDVILPRVLDDGTFATLSSLMLFNNVEVLMALTQVRPGVVRLSVPSLQCGSRKL